MVSQRAGQKRKVVEVPRPDPEEEEDVLENGDIDDAFEEEGESEDDISEEDDDEDDFDGIASQDEGEELDSDEIPSSDEEAAKPVNGKSGKRATTPPHQLMGSETAVEVATLSPETPVRRLEYGLEKPEINVSYRIAEDANGNPRYIYNEIEPNYDSDDSAPETTNTIGNIPLSYYDEFPHIGYDINGRRIARPAKGEALDSLLDSIDIPEGWTGLTDPSTGKPLQLSSEELEVLKKLTRNEAPGDGYDPYPDMVEYFTGKGMEMTMPLSAAPEPKRRFVPSMHEHKRVMKMVKAIKEGRIKPFRERTEEDREREEQQQEYASYDIWSNEVPRPDHVMNIPAPKLPPPGYEESYHPPPEYLPDKREREEWEKQDEEDRDTAFLPEDHSALRKVPGYAKFVMEKFERCLDLYLAPRVRRSKLNIDPESLLPKLPDPNELRPFPSFCAAIYRGHEGRVRSVAIDPEGRYAASGGDDGTVRVWELLTGRQLWRIRLASDEAVNVVSWRPGHDACILAACCGETVYFILPQGELSNPELESQSREVLDAGFGHAASNPSKTADGKDKTPSAAWSRPPTSQQDRGILLTLTLRSTAKTLVWHRRGDYFSTVCPGTSTHTSTAIAIHTLSKHQTQHPFKKLKGLAQSVSFHPTKPHFFVATRQRIRIYDLQQQKLEKELQPGARWISSLSLHPLGSNLLVSSYDKRLLWHDLDLGSTPYKTLRYHSKAIRAVKFHPTLPLFADSSDDGTVQVFHGKVVGDGLENATVVPLKVLKGHKVRGELGVLDVEWHPREAWCVSAGADGTIRLWM
ncbi:NUC169 domain-containing protein [Neohortaea acidophila]|uniref:Ribosome biogenesis protein ERB1 n=1 Tax=Neohortaea acidophila TaxID=245834 RepID=A0A6A6PWC1_9PEZI|nr:NUC169 domain-containing protein [Neohortaea acidophila]KAF2484285.1 NUC169 domain-containing protein [Neohortaea acidophila]